MKKKCDNCKIYFHITKDDEVFYQKIGVPPPTFCLDCRYQRRLAHRNERVLYLRACSATGKEIVSIYPQDAPFPVYDKTYWRSDKWDPLLYGREFDFSRPFFEQFYELRLAVPRININNYKSVNSPYTNQSSNNRDCLW